MLAQSLPVIPPAPKVHAKDLPTWRHLLTAQRNSIAIFPDYAFDVPFARRTLLGVDAVLINDPEGIRHVLATNAANYVRPTMMARVIRPLLGQGIFLAEGTEWRRQRRMLSPTFTPHNVGPMAGFVQGIDREQVTLFPARLAEYVAEENPDGPPRL